MVWRSASFTNDDGIATIKRMDKSSSSVPARRSGPRRQERKMRSHPTHRFAKPITVLICDGLTRALSFWEWIRLWLRRIICQSTVFRQCRKNNLLQGSGTFGCFHAASVRRVDEARGDARGLIGMDMAAASNLRSNSFGAAQSKKLGSDSWKIWASLSAAGWTDPCEASGEVFGFVGMNMATARYKSGAGSIVAWPKQDLKSALGRSFGLWAASIGILDQVFEARICRLW